MLTPETSSGAEILRLRDRLLIAPGDAGAMSDLAALLETTGDLPGAIDLYQRALRVDPYQVDVVLALGRDWAALGDLVRARSWFERALAIDEDCAGAAEGLARLDPDGAMTPAYIRTLFDQYATRFDQELTQTLGYRAPQCVAAALDRAGLAESSADMLDLGCGTGLSGVALCRFARRLEGVDLSPGMIEQAWVRAIYAELTVADAVGFLSAAARNWDVVAAVDVLNYVGDLTALFAAAAGKLTDGGLLAGTVEKGEGGVALTGKRRYVHGADHLRAALQAAGLPLLDLAEEDLRNEGGVPVAGLVFVARREK